MKNALSLILLIGISLLSTSCGTREIYNTIQNNMRVACHKRPPQMQSDCYKEADKSFETYKPYPTKKQSKF